MKWWLKTHNSYPTTKIPSQAAAMRGCLTHFFVITWIFLFWWQNFPLSSREYPLSCLQRDLLHSLIMIFLYNKLQQNKFSCNHSNCMSVCLCIISYCFQVAPFTRAIFFPSIFQNYKIADIPYWYMLRATTMKTSNKVFEPAVLFWIFWTQSVLESSNCALLRVSKQSSIVLHKSEQRWESPVNDRQYSCSWNISV